jgi:hypothetical protein
MDSFPGGGGAVAERDQPLPFQDRHELLEAVVLLGPGAGGEEAVRLRPEELRPGRSNPARSRAEAALAKHRGDGRGRDVDPELQEFASDSEVAPPGVLRPSRRIRCLIEGSRGGRPGRPDRRRRLLLESSRCHLMSVSGPTTKLFHRSRGQQLGSSCQERAIGIGEAGSGLSSTKDLQLVAEHGPLQIPLVDAKAQEQAQQATEEPVAQRQEHLAKSEGSSTHPPNGEVKAPIEFLYPHRIVSGNGLTGTE